MNSTTEWRALLRTRADTELKDSFRVRVCSEQMGLLAKIDKSESLWIGDQRGTHLSCRLFSAAASAAEPGLLIEPRPDLKTRAPDLSVIAAVLSSRILHAAFAKPLTVDTLEATPLPERNALFEAQLAALWHHGVEKFGAKTAQPTWRPILASFDRICAELYHLTLDELMETL